MNSWLYSPRRVVVQGLDVQCTVLYLLHILPLDKYTVQYSTVQYSTEVGCTVYSSVSPSYSISR